MNKTKVLISVAVVALAAGLLFLKKKSPSSTDPSPSIAVILPLTGQSAFLGEFCRNGMQLALDEVNSKGGVATSNLVLEFADSKNEAKEGITAFQKSILSRPAAVVVAMSSVTSAIAPLADSQKIPLFATMVSSKGATENHPMMFRLFINADIDAKLMAEFAAKTKGMKNVSIVNVNDEMGASFSQVFTETFTKLGGNINLTEAFDKSAVEFRDIAAKIKSVPSDGVYLIGYDRNLGQLAKALREQGVNQPLLSIATIAQDPVRAVAGAALNNTFFTSVQFDAENPSGLRAKAFVGEYEKRFGKKPTYFSAFAYDSILLLAEAMKSKGTRPEALVQGLQSIESFDGAAGTISFSGTRDARFPMTVKLIEGGIIKPLQ